MYDGKSVEEVERIMDENAEMKKKYQEEARKSALEERQNKEITSLLETAEASFRVGLISKSDLEAIKQDVEKNRKKIYRYEKW